MAYQRVEILSGTERWRRYTPAEKVRMVEEAFRPGVVVTDAARRLGVHESLLYRWRRLMVPQSGVADPPGFIAVTITPEPATPAVMAGDAKTLMDADEIIAYKVLPSLEPFEVRGLFNSKRLVITNAMG